MSVSTLSVEADVISRLHLAKSLREGPNAEPPENSAIFNRQRSRQAPSKGFYIPRPMNLLIPPILGNAEEYYKDNNFAAPSSQPNVSPSQQQPERRPSQPQINITNPRNSVIMSEERRGSASKPAPATLLDVRQSMLQVRQNIQNSIPFSVSSSQKTSIITQQNKSLPVDTNGKPHGSSRLSAVTNSRPNSVVSSRPISSYTNNTNARSGSSHKSNKSLNSDENEDEENKSNKSQKSKEIKKNEISTSSDDSDPKAPPLLPPIKSVANQSITLEKVEEEDSSSSSEDDDDDDDDDSSGDDTPLALKSTPKIKVAPPRITTRKGSSGGRIEAWLEHVSGSPEGPSSRSSTPTHSPRPSTPTHSPRSSTPHSPRSSTPNHSPTLPHSPRVRKTSEHSIYNSSPLSPHRMAHAAEPTYDARNRRPKSAFFSENLQAPTPDFHQPRKRSNSEFVPKIRPNSFMYDQIPQVPVPPFPGRVSPSPRQDSGYWAKDTLIALSDDLRHISLMNDPNSPHSHSHSHSRSHSHSSSSRNRSSSVGNISSNNAKLSPLNNNISKVINRHRREGSGSSLHSNKSSNPQLHVPPQGSYLSQIPATQSSRTKDTLHAPPIMNGNRNSLYMNGNGIPQRFSSEQLKTNRNSTYSHHQQKHRIKS